MAKSDQSKATPKTANTAKAPAKAPAKIKVAGKIYERLPEKIKVAGKIYVLDKDQMKPKTSKK